MALKDERIIFSPGDWIVHNDHGIGQIVAIEDKSIGGEETTYYRIKTDNSILWVPLGEERLLRLAASSEDFAQAMAVLQRPSRRMSAAFQSRMARIRQAKDKGTPRALASVVRDLWARQKRRGKLSTTEHRTLRNLIDRLLAEWSVSMEMDKSETRQKLYVLLRQNALPAARKPIS